MVIGPIMGFMEALIRLASPASFLAVVPITRSVPSYPRAFRPHNELAILDQQMGEWEKSLRESQEALRLYPRASSLIANTMMGLISLAGLTKRKRLLSGPSRKSWILQWFTCTSCESPLIGVISWLHGGKSTGFQENQKNSRYPVFRR